MNVALNLETTTGGSALKFYSSACLGIPCTGVIEQGDDVVGNETRIKVAAPFKQVEFGIFYSEGITRYGEFITLGAKIGRAHV